MTVCTVCRERRLGIDRVHDDPERQLIKEVEVMEGVLEMLCRSREQAKEQVSLCHGPRTDNRGRGWCR